MSGALSRPARRDRPLPSSPMCSQAVGSPGSRRRDARGFPETLFRWTNDGRTIRESRSAARRDWCTGTFADRAHPWDRHEHPADRRRGQPGMIPDRRSSRDLETASFIAIPGIDSLVLRVVLFSSTYSRQSSKSLAKTCKSASHRPVALRSRIHRRAHRIAAIVEDQAREDRLRPGSGELSLNSPLG